MMAPPANIPDTIFALSSGRGRAGVAVIRVSGPAASQVLERMASPCPPPRRAAFRQVRDPETGEHLDSALVLYFAAPASETGEDIAELQVHGSPSVIRAVLSGLARMSGCRLAEPGEFARRAFLNGKLDLTAAEGLADLIDAETDAQRRQALTHASGAFARLCDDWRTQLLEARALVEAALDFSDESDVVLDATTQARALIEPLLASIRQHLVDAHRGEIVRDGFRVVLAGPPNAGKSSLINALARRDVAIVSPEPGTTRDVLEVHLDLAGYAVIVADTAGLRDAGGPVEREGMRRSLERSHTADLVLWLVDATEPVWTPPQELATDPSRILVVVNKCDLVPDATPPTSTQPPTGRHLLAISALTGAGLSDLVASLTRRVEQAVDGAADALIPTQARHRMALADCVDALARSLGAIDAEPELLAEDLRAAADALGRITGRIDSEEILGAIFGRFCIGK